MSTVNIPLLNPIRLVQTNNPYIKRFSESMASFETEASYIQPWNNEDCINFQFSTNMANPYVYARIINTDGNFVAGFTRVMYENRGGLYYYQYALSLASIPEGYYYVHLTISSPPFLANFYSEPIHVAASHENTIKIRYSHDQNDYGILFIPSPEWPMILQMRVEGGFLAEHFNPASKDVIFINQTYEVSLVNSVPFVTQKLTLGNGLGLPFWMADKVNRIFSCNQVTIDGVNFTKLEGAKMEGVKEKLYPLAWWSLDVIQNNNDFFDKFNEITEGGDFNNDFNTDFNIVEV